MRGDEGARAADVLPPPLGLISRALSPPGMKVIVAGMSMSKLRDFEGTGGEMVARTRKFLKSNSGLWMS